MVVIAAKRIREGVLGEAQSSGRMFVVVSHTSDSFESRSGPGPDHANSLTISGVVGSTQFLTGNEQLALDLYESDDETRWDWVAQITTAVPTSIPPTPGPFSVSWDYIKNGPTDYHKRYFRIQFNVDEQSIVFPGPATPYPNYPLRFDGTCWASVVHK